MSKEPTPPAPADNPTNSETPATEAPKGRFSERLIAAVAEATSEPKPEKKEPSPGKESPEGEKTPAEPTPERKEGDPEKPSAGEEADPDEAVEADIKKATASMSAAHKAAFTNLRYEARDYKRRLQAAEKELADLRANPAATTEAQTSDATAEVERLRQELEATKTRLTEYEGEIKVSRLEATEEFKARVLQPREQIGLDAEEIATKYKIDADQVIRAFTSQDSDAVAAVTADMNEFDRYRFYDLVKQFRAVAVLESDMRKNAASELDRISQVKRQSTEAEQTRRLEEWKAEAPKAFDVLQEEFPALAPIEGDAEWNKSLEQVKEFASPDRYGKLTTREQAETLLRAAAFPVLRVEFETMREENTRLKAELEKFESALPDVRAGRDDAAASASDEEFDPKLTFGERVAQRLRKEKIAS